MTDVVDVETRSRMMAGIKGKNTKPEIRLRKALHRAGFRFRLHDPRLPGRPDIILPKYRAAILVHGCYWHRHEDCKNATSPKTNTSFWEGKFARNIERDAANIAVLHEIGWRVGIVWECAVRQLGAQAVVAELSDWLKHPGEPSRSVIEVSGPTSDVAAR